MGARLDPADVAELQFACLRCGAGVLVAVATRPDGTRAAACPAACDEGHPLGDDQRRTLEAQALRIVEARAAAAARREADGEPA
jgi:hypothetical protein